MRCPSCDYSNIDGASYCAWCKKPVPRSVTPPAGPKNSASLETTQTKSGELKALPDKPSAFTPSPTALKFCAWTGAVMALAGNGVFVYLWRSELRNRLSAFAVITSVIVGLIGYYFGRKIAEKPTTKRELGLGFSGGALIGAVNGSGVFPVIGTIIGAIIGGFLGLLFGPIIGTISATASRNNR